MYSFLLEAAVKPDHEYQWFTYFGSRAVKLDYRGKEVVIEKGQRFGVRPSRSGKEIRLVLPNDNTRVITISINQARRLANRLNPEVPK